VVPAGSTARAGLRKQLTTAIARGNVFLHLRITREDGSGAIDGDADPQLEAALDAAAPDRARAMDAG